MLPNIGSSALLCSRASSRFARSSGCALLSASCEAKHSCMRAQLPHSPPSLLYKSVAHSALKVHLTRNRALAYQPRSSEGVSQALRMQEEMHHATCCTHANSVMCSVTGCKPQQLPHTHFSHAACSECAHKPSNRNQGACTAVSGPDVHTGI